MRKIAISEFKTTCLVVLEEVRRTRDPVVVTRYGEPVAEIVPPGPPERAPDWLGAMRSEGRITGDIVEPAMEEGDEEMLQE